MYGKAVCMAGGCVWQGVCMAGGGVHGRKGHAWQGSMHGRSHALQEKRRLLQHPNRMHSCFLTIKH